MVLKEQKRKCSSCLKEEKRTVTQEESIFTISEKYFWNWNTECVFCKDINWESLSESYLTENQEEMKIQDSLINSWRIDDTKRFNPQDDCIEFSNIESEKILNWIDKLDTTAYKRTILVEVLCYRLDDLTEKEISNQSKHFLLDEFLKRKRLIKCNLDNLDTDTKNVIISMLNEN